MAPVSNNAVVGIDDDQRFALMKFRKNVKDVLNAEHNDHFLLRWLRARQWDADAAEKMLRDSMIWREKWGVDTTLKDWVAPDVLEKHFPSGSTGFDKEGSPVIIVPFVGLDVWGLLHSIQRSDVIRMVIRHLEGYLETARKQELTHGAAALKLQSLISAPTLFSLAFSVVKKFMHEYTISKIKIYGTDTKKWQAQALAIIDKEQLPKHYGGTMVDDNGDPRCSLIVKPGGKVPKSCYAKNAAHSESKEHTRVTIKTGEKHTFELICIDPESVLKWEIGVDNHEIKFLIIRRDEAGHESVVYGPSKVTEDSVDVGILPVTGPATYSIVFDNKSAFLRSKKVFYDVMITVPTKELNLNDMPEDTEPKDQTVATSI